MSLIAADVYVHLLLLTTMMMLTIMIVAVIVIAVIVSVYLDYSEAVPSCSRVVCAVHVAAGTSVSIMQ